MKVPKVTQVSPCPSEEDQVKKQEKQQRDVVSLGKEENDDYDATERLNERGDFVQAADWKIKLRAHRFNYISRFHQCDSSKGCTTRSRINSGGELILNKVLLKTFN